MFENTIKIAAAITLATGLASCETAGMFPKPGEAYVKEVTVTTVPSARNPVPAGFSTRVSESMKLDAQRFPQSGAAKHMSIVVTDYHLKSPALSLLVGDSNYVKGTMTVSDVATGTASPPTPFAVANEGAINGVVGAIRAANQDTGLVEGVLVVQTGRSTLEKFYGTKLLKAYTTGAPVAPPAAPVAAQATSTAKPAPVKRKPTTRQPAAEGTS